MQSPIGPGDSNLTFWGQNFRHVNILYKNAVILRKKKKRIGYDLATEQQLLRRYAAFPWTF